ncbi:bifunctional metallophosphatase/5'-nucleotidase [Halobacteriales archaeon QS_4_66_20]|nr:MAG: bifunctional metallophosphatase/5'-nucleotidase [Halobacteriales archaeon QS_4_66_20]
MGLRLLQYADIETAYDTPEQIGRLAGLINQLRNEATIVCGSGDNIGPGVLSLVTHGRQALDYFRAVEADVDTFGNHDFDHGLDALLDIVDEAPQTWVCANAFNNGKRLAADEGAVPWTIIKVGSHRVGVIGVTHPETAEINPNASDVRFTDPVSAVEQGINTLQDRHVDHIVVLSHLGDDTELAKAVNVDVILGGHDHVKLINRVDDTLVCRPGGTGRYLLEVTFDDRPTATHHTVSDGPLDRNVTTALRNRIDAAGLGETVGTIEEPIICDLMACKRAESRIGNLITDAYRWKTGADVSVNSGGGFRRHPPLTGKVTAFDLVKVTPYESDLVLLRVDGDAMMATLRHLALADAPDDLPRWHFGHVSGAELVWDDASEELLSATINGEPVKSNRMYELATTEFFVENEDLFPAFGPDDVIDCSEPQYEAVIEYAREKGVDPQIEGRISRTMLTEDKIPERDWPYSP